MKQLWQKWAVLLVMITVIVGAAVFTAMLWPVREAIDIESLTAKPFEEYDQQTQIVILPEMTSQSWDHNQRYESDSTDAVALKVEQSEEYDETTTQTPEETEAETEPKTLIPETDIPESTWSEPVQASTAVTEHIKTEVGEDENARLDIVAMKAGTSVRAADIQASGIDSYFYSGPISNAVFARMKGKSFASNCTIPREDLRYLRVLHYNLRGNVYVGELVCHKDISDSLLEIFMELYKNKYPIQNMRLVDDYGGDDLASAAANNTSCFNYRVSAGEGTSLSRHAYGKAIDINPLYNPYVWWDSEENMHCDPAAASPYIDRDGNYSYKLDEDDLCVKLFKQYGYQWGGDWGKDKDYMHFSFY